MKRLLAMLMAMAAAPLSALELAWVVQLDAPAVDGGAKLRPVAAHGRVCAFSWSGVAACFDGADGRILWSREGLGRVSGGPTFDGNDFYFATREGEVVAWDEVAGQPLWRVHVDSEVLAPPVRAGDLLLVQTLDDRLYALDVRDGSVVWTHERSTPPLSLRGTAVPVVEGTDVYAGFAGGQLVALRLEDGALRWETVVAVPRGRSDLERMVDVDATPLPGDGLVYSGAFQGRLLAVSKRDGEVVWERRLSLYRAPVLHQGGLYLVDAEGAVLRLDPHSGATLWRQAELPEAAVGPVSWVGEALVVSTVAGGVLRLDPENGAVLARLGHDAMRLRINAHLGEPADWENEDDIDLARLFRRDMAPLGLPLVQGGMLYQLYQDGLFAAIRP